nr:sigma factor-like helix-turn-helix DNA-binding protein [Pseudenhygromyxa sp. WMMC2535]
MGQTLSQAFERLAFDEQDLLGLRYFEGLSLADLSALEKVREGTVQARVSRALAHLGELCQEIAGSAAVPSPARLEGELRALAASRGRLE